MYEANGLHNLRFASIYTGAHKIYGLLRAPRLNLHHLSYKEQANTFISMQKFFKIVKALPCSCFTQNKALSVQPQC